MYDEIFSQITNAANKRNLRDSTIHAYCTSMLQAYQADHLHFLVPAVQKQCIRRFHEGLSRPDLKSRYHKS